MVASTSWVGVLVMDCTATGWAPPKGTRPTQTVGVGRLIPSMVVHWGKGNSRTGHLPGQRGLALLSGEADGGKGSLYGRALLFQPRRKDEALPQGLEALVHRKAWPVRGQL